MIKEFFHDEAVQAVIDQGRVADLGPFSLHLPEAFGFCGGVMNAIQSVERVVEANSLNRIWLLGELIHNETVNQLLQKAGVTILANNELNDIFQHAGPEDTILIPAFGIPKALENELYRKHPNHLIVDTTCRYIKQIWDFAERMAAENRTFIIYGDPNHAETVATISRAQTDTNAVIVLPSTEELSLLEKAITTGNLSPYPKHLVKNAPCVDFRNLAFAEQTTKLYNETSAIQKRLRDTVGQAGDGRLECAQTVCKATQERQDAAIDLCRKHCDCILVIGGYTSSNTTQLYKIAQRFCPTYFIDNADAISADAITHFLPEHNRRIETLGWLSHSVRNIGILAGASCPSSDIGDTIRKLYEISEIRRNERDTPIA